MIRAMGNDARFVFGGRIALLLAASLSLTACVTRPANTDLFGRPLTPGDSAAPAGTPASNRAPTTGGRPVVPDPGQVTPVDLPPSRPGSPSSPTSSAPTSWTPAVVTPSAREVVASRYVVAPGDTLRGIGNRTGAGSEAIAAANALEPPYTLRVGQALTIPSGRYHEVLAGQSGIAIARAYGVSWSALIEENALVEPYLLRVGQRLRLPDSGAPPRPRSIEEQAQAFHLDIDGIMAGNQPAGTTTARPASNPASAANPTGPATAGPGRFAWPLTGTLLQRFGPAGNGRVNNGINIAAARGTPVRTTAPGTVTYAGREIALFGGLILIDHGGGWTSAYGHLDQIDVSVGQTVRAGQPIATTGESGQVQEPQLHFELRRDTRPVDPLRQLPVR